MENSTGILVSPPGPTMSEPVFFSPSSIVAIFNAATTTREEKRIIQVRGIFKKSGASNYGGNYYNRLKDEASDNTISLITSAIIHNKLEDNKTIEFTAFITRRTDKQGRIELIINFIELLSQRINKFSEEETKKIILINQKVTEGFKDLDAHIKKAIYNKRTISIKIIMGKAGIIDADIKQGIEAAIALYEIEYHRISLSSPTEIINKIYDLDVPGTDLICIARGGGDNLIMFENLDICTSILQRSTIIASAIGHASDVSLFEKLSDKKFITPTQFGNYLKEIYNTTIEELENSKASLAKDISTQLTANYNQQITNIKEQLLATKEQNKKIIADTQQNHQQQLHTLQEKLKSFEELVAHSAADKLSLHTTEVNNLKKEFAGLLDAQQQQTLQRIHLESEKTNSFHQQIAALQAQQIEKEKLIQQSNKLAQGFQKQLADKKTGSSISVIAIIIAIAAGLIIGLIIGHR